MEAPSTQPIKFPITHAMEWVASNITKRRWHRNEKIENKWIFNGCPFHIQIKTFPHTAIVLEKYISNHSHSIGLENLKFIYMQDSTQKMIASILRYWKNDKNLMSDSLSNNNWFDLSLAEKEYI